MTELQIIQDTTPVAHYVDRMRTAIVGGEVDPIVAFCNVQKLAKVLDEFGKDKEVRRCILDEFDKYGQKKVQKGDITLEASEIGVKYDYSYTNDERLADMYRRLDWLKAEIKEREEFLKHLPASGQSVVDETTGECVTLYPPVKTSTSWIKTTIKK